MQLRTRPWQRSLTVAQKRSRRDRRTFLDALEFASVLDFLDGRSLFFYGCTQRSACSVSEAFCRAVVQRRGWICGVGQSARQRLSRGGVFIDGITAYHDASQQPFNYRSWFDRCTTHSTLRIDEHNRCDEFRSIVAVGCAEPALASGDAPPLAFEAVWKPNIQPDFNVRVIERFAPYSSALLRELDDSNRFVQKSAESTTI